MTAGTDLEVVQRFFDRLMELRPVEATYHGLREHDGRLPEGSLAGVREQQALLERFESELAARTGLAEAARLLVAEAGLREADAEAEVRRCTCTPGYQLSYLYGKHLLLELRQRRRRLEGPAFDLRAFHDRLLCAGALPAATWDLLF